MSTFVQLHLLTSYPPANLNRDDLGRPKTAVMGGAQRLRVSSQSLKRAWRTSELFASALAGHIGTRSGHLADHLAQRLRERNIDDTVARTWASAVESLFRKAKKSATAGGSEKEQGKAKRKAKGNAAAKATVEAADDDAPSEANEGDTADDKGVTLRHLGPDELEALYTIFDRLEPGDPSPTRQALDGVLRERPVAADIALFGRMLAEEPGFNVDAAVQVAHAISVHEVAIEDDYFTAVDDLNRDNRGAGHVNEAEFAAGLFYLYLCINRDALVENLRGNRALADKAMRALTLCAAKVSPSGKQNSFASRAFASHILAEKGTQQPRSLAVAFLKPVMGRDLLVQAVQRMSECQCRLDEAYGQCADDRRILSTVAEGTSLPRGTVTMDALLDFVVS